jgi:hypothetical protein
MRTDTLHGFLCNIEQVAFEVTQDLFLTPLVIGWVDVRLIDRKDFEVWLTVDLLELTFESKTGFNSDVLVGLSYTLLKTISEGLSSDRAPQNAFLQRVTIMHRCSSSFGAA